MIDFLSDSPKNNIFQNKVNKTKLGGFLTLIYIIITLIILSYYLIFYFTEQTFSIEYTYNEQMLDENELNKRFVDETYNPYFNFSFDLIHQSGENLTDDFIIFDFENEQKVPRYTLLKKRISDITFSILYKCRESDINCTIPFNRSFFTFKAGLQGFILDHQNENIPLHLVTGKTYFPSKQNIIFNNPIYIQYNWRTIKYKKDPGLFRFLDKLKDIDEEKQKYIGIKGYGDIYVQPMKYMIENEKELIENINGTKYRTLGEVKFSIDFNRYEEYSRVKKDILDYLSSVCSLSTTIFNILSLVLTKIYSYNFDNYKIVEKILYDIKPDKEENQKKIKEKKYSNKIETLIQEKDNYYEDNQKYSINESEDNSIKNNEIKKRKLPKFNFFDFILNNIYCKCCKSKKHELISKCNGLITKYYSIETIIYNQIKFDNLLKDYKWNNDELSNFDENELINQIKSLITLYDNN